MSDIAIITSHYNWCDYQRPRANLMRFIRSQERDGHTVFGVEAYLSHQKPITTGIPGWHQVKVPRHAVMFQKEALLNLAETLVPDQYTKIVWADADITWTNPKWLAETSAALDVYKVVQPFDEAVWLGRCGEHIRTLPSMGALSRYEEVTGHPGFAMAARRELFTEHGGLFPWAISGRGDSICAAGFLATQMTDFARFSLGNTMESMMLFGAWAEPVGMWTKGKIGHVSGTVYHDFHGDLGNRLYNQRHSFVEGMVVPRDLKIHDDGYAVWTEEADPVIMAAVSDYFKTRAEDE